MLDANRGLCSHDQGGWDIKALTTSETTVLVKETRDRRQMPFISPLHRSRRHLGYIAYKKTSCFIRR